MRHSHPGAIIDTHAHGNTQPVFDALVHAYASGDRHSDPVTDGKPFPFLDGHGADHTQCITNTVSDWNGDTVAEWADHLIATYGTAAFAELHRDDEAVFFADARRRNRERFGPDAAEDRYRPGR